MRQKSMECVMTITSKEKKIAGASQCQIVTAWPTARHRKRRGKSALREGRLEFRGEMKAGMDR